MEIVGTLMLEIGKGFLGELGKAGARALFSRVSPESATPNPGADDADELCGPREAVESFFTCLAAEDPGAAWSWCDPQWPFDPERGQSYNETFSFAPPINWVVKEWWGPEERHGALPDWLGAAVVVTFKAGNGTYSAHPAIVVAIPTHEGWRIGDVVWEAQAETQPETPVDPAGWQVTCERCPELLTVPFGEGAFKIRCAACWTPQTIDRGWLWLDLFGDEPVERTPTKRVIRCERCPQKLSIPGGVGRIRLKCPACCTPQEFDT